MPFDTEESSGEYRRSSQAGRRTSIWRKFSALSRGSNKGIRRKSFDESGGKSFPGSDTTEDIREEQRENDDTKLGSDIVVSVHQSGDKDIDGDGLSQGNHFGLSISLSIYLSVLSACLCSCLFVCLFFCLSLSVHPSIHPYSHPPIHQSTHSSSVFHPIITCPYMLCGSDQIILHQDD